MSFAEGYKSSMGGPVEDKKGLDAIKAEGIKKGRQDAKNAGIKNTVNALSSGTGPMKTGGFGSGFSLDAGSTPTGYVTGAGEKMGGITKKQYTKAKGKVNLVKAENYSSPTTGKPGLESTVKETTVVDKGEMGYKVSNRTSKYSAKDKELMGKAAGSTHKPAKPSGYTGGAKSMRDLNKEYRSGSITAEQWKSGKSQIKSSNKKTHGGYSITKDGETTKFGKGYSTTKQKSGKKVKKMYNEKGKKLGKIVHKPGGKGRVTQTRRNKKA